MKALCAFVLILTFSLLGNVYASSFRCSRYCKENWNKFGYKTENAYLYKYTGSTNTTISGTHAQTELLITSHVLINVISNCDYVMQLTNVRYQEVYVNKQKLEQKKLIENLNDFTKNSLYFSFQNGRIDTICPVEDEERHVLHIKKAILSAFQNSMSSFEKDAVVYEADISGICDTKYQHSKTGNKLTIDKVKNLDNCSNRKLHHTSWTATPYSKNLPKSTSTFLLKSSQECRQIINEDLLLESSECTEKHLFRPFSHRENGVKTLLKQTLQFVSITRSTFKIQPQNFQYDSLLSNYEDLNYSTSNGISTIEALLEELEKHLQTGSASEVPGLFSHLVKHLKNFRTKDFIKIFEYTRESSKQKKFLLDAMPLVTTVDSVQAMRWLYENEIISDTQMNSWLNSLLFRTEISLPFIEAITPLLELDNFITQKAVLSISTLAYTYCKQDSQCFQKDEVQKLLLIIQKPLKDTCTPRSWKNHNEILLALKGIGNIGVETSLPYLKKCYTNNDSPLELRLAAIAAHRRVKCLENSNLEHLIDYFGQINQNVEIRIASYLAAMQCASYATIAKVKDVLRYEEINQVGSFVWTHLTNLQESSSQLKQNLKSLVENEFFRNKFSTDVRKYSRNYEMSTFLESLNAGGTIESNVVFTSESYLPKSIMLNFTLDLFGETVNLFEFGTRIEGFEPTVENLFGPEGYFPEESLRNILEGVKSANLSHIRKEPSGLVYSKIFGNEFFFSHFKDFESFVKEPNVIDGLMKFLKKQSVDYSKTVVFLDSAYKIPTLLGLPLELTTNGTAFLGFEIDGKVDLKDLGQKVNIEGKAYSNCAVDVIGSMTIESFNQKIGVISSNTLNYNSYLDGHVFVNKGKLVDIKLNIPKKEINVFKVESKGFFVNGNKTYAMDDVTDNVETMNGCTGKAFANVTGLQLCHEMRFVNASSIQDAPYFPLTGQFKYLIKVFKMDVFDSYHLVLKTHSEVKLYRPFYKISLNFDTLNSLIDRKIKAFFLLDCEQLAFNATLDSPFVNFDVHAKVGGDVDNLGFLLQTKLNDKEIIVTKVTLKSTKVNDTWSYKPSADLTYKNLTVASISGNINYLSGKKYDVNFKLNGILTEAILLVGNLDLDDENLNLTAAIKSSALNGNVKTLVIKSYESTAILSNIVYDYKNSEIEHLDFEFKQNFTRKNYLFKDSLYLSFNSTQEPFYNTLVSFKSQRNKLYFENSIVATLFTESWKTKQLFKFHKFNGNTDIVALCTLQGIKRNIDYAVQFVHLNDERQFKLILLAQLNKVQRVEMNVDYAQTPLVNQTFSVLLYYPQQALNVNGSLIRRTQHYDIEVDTFYEEKEEKRRILHFFGEYSNSTNYNIQNHTVAGSLEIFENGSKVLQPWMFFSSMQLSPELFISTTTLNVIQDHYLSHLTWSPDSFSGLLRINQKELFAVSAMKSKHEISVLLGLNIYQHFELNLNLIKPYKKLYFLLYWDKDRDMSQKVSLVVDSQIGKGLYLVAVEYPNQKVTASFVILPVQVTINVTWGLDSSKRIYLKAGNKVYNIGGLWFAKLTTPFKYLEHQEVQLSYYIIPQNAELKLDMIWSDKKVNLVLSGMKSRDRLSGYLDVNTTIHELSKISVAGSHYFNQTNEALKYKTDFTLILNTHHVLGQLIWNSSGSDVSSNFEIVSPSKTILPISGLLQVQNNQTTNFFQTKINWKEDLITASYKLENANSYLKVETPFQGLEYIEAKYSLIEVNNDLLLDIKVNVLKELHYMMIFWSEDDRSNVVKVNLVCPMIGVYKVLLKHSTEFGYLNEVFEVEQSKDKVLLLNLLGEFTPSFLVKAKAIGKFFNHSGLVRIENSFEPLSSLIELKWEKHYALSALGKTEQEFYWKVNSSLLEEDVLLKFAQLNNSYDLIVHLLKHFNFANKIELNIDEVKNDLKFKLGSRDGTWKYYHKLSEQRFDQHAIFKVNKSQTNLTVFYNWGNELDKGLVTISTPWNSPVELQYSMLKSEETYHPVVYLKYFNITILNLDCFVNLSLEDGDVKASLSSPYVNPLHLKVKWSSFNQSKICSLQGILSSHRNLLNISLNFDLLNLRKTADFKIALPEISHQTTIHADIIDLDELHGNFLLVSSAKAVQKLFLNFNLNQNSSYVNLGKNNQRLIGQYFKNYSEENGLFHHSKLTVTSNFEQIQNFSSEMLYSNQNGTKEFIFVTNLGNYTGKFNGNLHFPDQRDFRLDCKLKGEFYQIFNDTRVKFLDLDAKGLIKFEHLVGKVYGIVSTNIPDFKKVEGDLTYELGKTKNRVKAVLTYNNNEMFFQNHFGGFLKDFDVFVTLQITGHAGKINILKEGNVFNANIFFDEYRVMLVTQYDSFLSSKTDVQVLTPLKNYGGGITCNFTLLDRKFEIFGDFQNVPFLSNFSKVNISGEYDLFHKKDLYVYITNQNGAIYDLALSTKEFKVNFGDYLNVVGVHRLNKWDNIALDYHASSKTFAHDKTYKISYLSKFNISNGLNFTTHLNGNFLAFNLTSILLANSAYTRVDFHVDLQTVIANIERIFLTVSFNRNMPSLFVEYAQNNNFELKIIKSPNSLSFKSKNPWRPISLDYDYYFGEKIKASGKVCWDLNHSNISQLGAEIYLDKNVSLKIILPTRTMTLQTSHLVDQNVYYYFGRVSWFQNEQILASFYRLKNSHRSKYDVQVEVPFRILQFGYDMESLGDMTRSTAGFKWNKCKSCRIAWESLVAVGQLESKLFLPGLEHDISLKIDSSKNNSSNLKAEVEYSRDVNKRLLLEIKSSRSERQIILRHPASKIDYSWIFKLEKGARFTTGNMTFRYINYFLRRPEKIHSSITIGKLFEMSGSVQTVKNYLGFATQTKSGKDSKGFSVTTQLDKKEPLEVEADVIYKPSGSSLGFLTSRGSTRNYEFYLGFPSKRELSAQLVNTIFAKETVDGRFTLKLNSSQILWLQINWKNNWLSKFKDSMLEDYYDLRYIIEEIGQQFVDVIDDDIGVVLLDDLEEIQQNFNRKLAYEIEIIRQDYFKLQNNIRNGCQANSFYCKEVINASKVLFPQQNAMKLLSLRYVSNAFTSLHTNFQKLKQEILETLSNASASMYLKVSTSVKFKSIKQLKSETKTLLKDKINEARKSVNELDLLVDQISENLENYVEETKKHCEEFLEPYLKLLDDFVIYIEQRLAILQLLVLDILDEVQYYILNLRESREFLKAYVWYVNWLEEIHITDILEPIADVIEAILDVLITDTKNIIEDYRPYIDFISEAIFGNYEEINKLFPFEKIRFTLNQLYQKTIWIWNYHNLFDTIKACFHKVLAEIDEYLGDLLMLDHEGNDFENILGRSDYIFRPDIGVIEITQPLPVEWEAFDEMPHFNQLSLYNKLKRGVENLIQLERYHFVDLFNSINSYLGESSNTLLAPPTNNIGIIVGDSHYITFDKKYYNFVGECSYLLASDFYSKSFSVVINYKLNKSSVKKHSISVISDGNNLEISPDFTVKLNNAEIDLPLITDTLIVVLENSKVILEHYKGLKIICNLDYNFCIVELSGWLFGKTRGLLGTLDNEKFTDTKLPDGDRTNDLSKFVQSWQIGSNCSSNNRVDELVRKDISPLTVTLYETLCKIFFVNVNSPIGNCFNLVDSKPFYDMCLNNMKQVLNSTMCSTVAAYKAQCARSNVQIQMPELCVFCNHGIGLNDVIFDRDNYKSVDVVIIKEDGCKPNFGNLAVDLNLSLEKRGFTNNKFLIVGYGDVIGKPYVFLSKKQIWNSAENASINNLKTKKVKQHVSAIKAIKFALNLEFRPGVSKQFILMQCNSNTDDENLNILHNTFLEKDIIFHVLNFDRPNQYEQLLELYSNGHALYIPNYVNTPQIPSEINTVYVGMSDQITDIYSLLALSTNGTVLNLNNEVREENKIIKSWAEVISKTAYRSPCQKCKCVTNLDGNGKIECTRCMSLIVKQLLNEYESNVMEFYQESNEFV